MDTLICNHGRVTERLPHGQQPCRRVPVVCSIFFVPTNMPSSTVQVDPCFSTVRPSDGLFPVSSIVSFNGPSSSSPLLPDGGSTGRSHAALAMFPTPHLKPRFDSSLANPRSVLHFAAPRPTFSHHFPPHCRAGCVNAVRDRRIFLGGCISGLVRVRYGTFFK